MSRACSAVAAVLIPILTGCHRSAPLPVPEAPPAVAEAKYPEAPNAGELEMMAALSEQGASALAGLAAESDLAHGATWFKGDVSARGNAAYLLLGKLGDNGASTLRLVVRFQGRRPVDLSTCNVLVDGKKIGSFSPEPNGVDQPGDGMVVQLADIHFDNVRPAVLAMISASSAVIRTADGAEIQLNRTQLEEMRRVLSAYLHLQPRSVS